jgi:hypothetical protein
MLSKSRLERAGVAQIWAGIGIMLFALVVAYVGGAMAPKPELVDQVTVRWVLIIALIGVAVDMRGLAYLSLAKELNNLEPFPHDWYASP